MSNYHLILKFYVAFNVTLNPESDEICIYPPSNLKCATLNEDDRFHVSIRDISQLLVFNDDITIGTCVYVQSLQFTFCAPFQVILSGMAYNISQG